MKDVFCEIIEGTIPANVVYEDNEIISIMDANPQSPGHLLIIPKRHYTTVLDMDSLIISKIHECAKYLMNKMEEVYPGISGIQMIVNYGSPQQVKHYHMNLIPVYVPDKTPQKTQKELCEMLKQSL